MINIAELLKDAPKGMKLYSPLFGEVEFMEVGTDKLLRVHDKERNGVRSFDFYGRYFYETFPDAECLLFPSKDCRTWEEWKLPVEPNFKVGDWVACDADSFTLSIKSVKDGNYYFHQGASLPIKDIDEHYHLWTIADAKDGDVLVTTKIRSCPFIYRKTDYNNNLAYYYAGIDGNGDFCEGCLKRTLYHFGSVSDVIPATKEQRDLLFAKMKEAGYEWDAGKKELRKIKPHYDISNFQPFDKVLVRDYNNNSL
jgi:hypothetical protein